jgi:hypothetical protein
MAADVGDQTVTRVHLSPFFALQVDESTDVTIEGHLLFRQIWTW